MNNIQLNIIANAQFQQVYAEVAKLKEAMLSLQKVSVGGPFAPGIATDIKAAQTAFDHAIMSTRAFQMQHVAMADSVNRFGKQLQAGKLSLNQYYKIWRDSAKGVSAELDALAASQARLNRSVAIADPLRPGYAKLITDLNGVVTAQEKAIFYQRALNTALHDGSMKLINFGKNTQWMGRQLTVGLAMPLAMLGAALSAVFIGVDKQLTRMQKVYGTGLIAPTQEALTQIRSDVQLLGNELAKSLGIAVKETATMAADLAATGLEGAKLLGATKEALRLTTLGELEHQQAMQATISLQNVYRLSTQGLTEAVDFLNAVENQTSTSLQDLVDAIPRVGPIVQQLGGSFKDTAAMMVAMKEAGVPAAQGANAIKSTLASLINPTTRAKEAFAAFNINLANIATSTGGNPIAMFKMLAEQMKGLDKLAQAQLIEKLFGKYQLARVQALIDNINKVGSQTQTVFSLMTASSADLARMSERELKQHTQSASGQFRIMIESVKSELVPLGQSFLKTFTEIGNIVLKIVHFIKKFGEALGPVGILLGKIFGGGFAGLVLIGPIIMLTGLFANLIGNILKGANYLRMFKQGMDQAGPSQNKFVAGLQNMRNFYQNLDAGIVAARNQMELMPQAITSNAKAFDILTASIRTLTIQFESFAAAQAMAMGAPMAKFFGPTAPAGARFLPIVPKNKGGIIPGFQNGGFTGRSVSKVPGPDHIDYDSVIGDIPLHGFVLNKPASKALLNGYENGGMIKAMLTPGELIFDPITTKENRATLEALNNRYAVGGLIKKGKSGYGIQNPMALTREQAIANAIKKQAQINASSTLGIDKSREAILKHFEFQTDKTQNVAAIDYIAKNYKSELRKKYGSSTNPQKVLSSEGLRLAKEAGYKISDMGTKATVDYIQKGIWFDEKVGSWRGVAKAMDEKFGVSLKPGERYGLYGEKYTTEGKVIVGYVRKPSSGLFGEGETYSSLVSLNNKRAGEGLIGKEIDDFIAASRKFGNGKIYGTASRFLDSMPISTVDEATKQIIKEKIDETYARRITNDIKEQNKKLNDGNDPYLTVTKEIFKEYESTNPELFNLYNELISKASAYNPVYLNELKAGRGHTGSLSIPLSNGVTIEPFEGSRADNTFFFHSIGGYAGGGLIKSGRFNYGPINPLYGNAFNAETQLIRGVTHGQIKSAQKTWNSLSPEEQNRLLASRGLIAQPKPVVDIGMITPFAKVLERRITASKLEEAVKNSSFANMPPTDFGTLLQPFSGRSFPIQGVGGIYRKPNGELVVVKPTIDEKTALAEIRATSIAREAHGLLSPKQTIRTMLDPTDITRQRKLIVLESPYNSAFANPTGKFTKDETIKQLVASLLRADKDLQASNLFGNILADVGPAGVFSRASGFRDYATNLPSMEDQAMINLLGVKGGARKFFAQETASIAESMTAAEYHSAIINEINTVLPRLRKVISEFKLTKEETSLYQNMITRLEEGRNVDWSKFRDIHVNAGIQAREKGGPVSSGNPYLVGEKGPELFVPRENGNILPHYAIGGLIRDGKYNYGPVKTSFLGGNRVITNAYVPPSIPPVPAGLMLPDPLGAMGPAATKIASANLPIIGQLNMLGPNIKQATIETGKSIKESIKIHKENFGNLRTNWTDSFSKWKGTLQNSSYLNTQSMGTISSRISSSLSLMSTRISESARTFYNKMDLAYRGMSPGARMGGGMGLMMGGGMLGSSVGGTAGQALTFGAMGAGLAMQMEKGIGGTFAFAGVAVAATLLIAGFHKLSEIIRENANLLKSEFSVSALAAEHLGVGINKLSNIHLLALDTNTKKTAESMQKNKDAIDALTQSYKNAEDQQTKDTIKKISGMSGKDLQDYVQKTYATYIAAGSDPTKSKQEIAAQLAAAGKTNLSMLDIKMPTYKTSIEGFKEALSNIGPLSTAYASPKGGGTIAVGEGSKKAGLAISSLALSDPENVNKVINNLKDWQKALFENRFVYQEFLNKIKESSPELAKLIDKMKDAGASTENLAKATSLVNSGLITTTEQFKLASTSIEYLNSLMLVWTDLQTLSDKPTIIKGTASEAQASAEADIKLKEKAIEQIQDEIKKRDELYNAQMRNIEAQQAQMNLEAEAVRARGSGDLIKLAIAQQNLQVQRSKDAMAKAKAMADTASQAKIDALQKEIEKIRSGKEIAGKAGTPDTVGDSPQKIAMKAIKKAMEDAQTNAEQFAKDLPALYESILKVVKDPKIAQDALSAALLGMEWTDFTKNIETIFDSLVTVFGDKAKAANFLFNDIELKLKQATIDALGEKTGTKVAEAINDIFAAELKARPEHAKEIVKAYADFAGSVAKDLSDPKLLKDHSKLMKELTDQAHKAAVEAYADELKAAGKDPKKIAEINAKIKALQDKLMTGISSNWDGAMKDSSNSDSMKKMIKDFVKGLVGAVVDFIKFLLFGAINGIKSALKALNPLQWAKAWASGFAGYFANGGVIRAATGLMVGPGGPKSDMIPALVSNGEYIVQADAVSKYGIPFMNALNNKTYSVPSTSFNAGVSSKISDAISNSTNYDGNTINVYAPEGANPNEIANMVLRQLDMQRQKQMTVRRVSA